MGLKRFSILIIFLLSGCYTRAATLYLDVPDGPPEYKAGWHDGCQSALSAGGFWNGKFYNFSMGNGAYQHDQVYITAWGNGWFSCVTSSGAFTGFPTYNTAPLQ